GVSSPVLNAGRSGASAADYAALASRNKGLFHPRWTIVQITPDDLGALAWAPGRTHSAYDESGRLVALARPVSDGGRLHAWLAPLVNRVMLLVYGTYRIAEFEGAACG